MKIFLNETLDFCPSIPTKLWRVHDKFNKTLKKFLKDIAKEIHINQAV